MLVEKQRPLYALNAAESKIIFACEDNDAILNNFKVHYEVLIEVKVFNNTAAGAAFTEFSGRFKAQPNAAGVGIFDLSPVIKNYVNPDYNGGEVSPNIGSGYFSQYKGTDYSENTPHPIHLIDKYSTSRKAVRFVELTYFSYGATTATGPVTLLDQESSHTGEDSLYVIFNGYLTRRDILNLENHDYGYDFAAQSNVILSTAGTAKFLTNAPTTQYVTTDDYGTLSFLTKTTGNSSDPNQGMMLTKIRVSMFNAAGSGLVSFDVNCEKANGGLKNKWYEVESYLQYVACSPANFKGWSSPWNSNIGNTSYYTVRGYSGTTAITQEYRFDIICEDVKGYESIRLTWLNKYGTWDYYTFTKKSTKTITRQSKTYQQLAGTWNEDYFQQFGYDGGKKNFVVNTKENFTINTRFLSEDEAVWFEELMNSPEVYILNGYQTDTPATVTNRYVEPVLLTTSSYVKKTKANDKLIQYSFNIERNTTNRTQGI